MPSVMQRVGTPNSRHNKDLKYRAQLENVDPSLSQYNKVIREVSIEKIYEEKLQPAFEEFNKNQKRKDRRLDVKWNCSTYLEYQRAMDEKARKSKNKIDQKGKPPIRELIWQFGNPEQGFGCKNQTKESRELAKKLLLECQKKAEKKYPQLAWGDLVFHADEVTQDADDKDHGSFHLHSSFVPLCYNNKQGTSVQVAFERCLKEMGFETFEAWKHDLDEIMEEVLKEHNLERTLMHNTEANRDSNEYHRQQKIIKQTKELEKERQAQEEISKNLKNEIEKQEEQLGLIKDYDEYCKEAVIIEHDMDRLEEAASELPEATKLFKSAAANKWLDRVMELLRDLQRLIEAGIRRLKLFEKRFEVEKPLSDPIEERKKGLDDKILNAEQRRQQQLQNSDLTLGKSKEQERE